MISTYSKLCLGLNTQTEIRILTGLYLSCIFRLFCKQKLLSQNLQKKASPVWTFSWAFKYHSFKKLFVQYWQGKGFSVRCVNSWAFRDSLLRKLFLQSLQSKGFSPLWIFSWSFIISFKRKLLLQCEQEKGFSPVWILSCLVRRLLRLRLLSQNLHWNFAVFGGSVENIGRRYEKKSKIYFRSVFKIVI